MYERLPDFENIKRAANEQGQFRTLRLAIHNYYAWQSVAETEFSRRIAKAACQLGWESLEAASSVEINDFDPDFVIALHFRTPKLTRFPTYGSMVTPPSFIVQQNDGYQFIKNILSYDGYLCSSEAIKRWLSDILYRTHKVCFVAPWFTTSHLVPYREPNLRRPRLLYAGTNWDGPRFGDLFANLDEEPYVDIYGPEAAWSHIRRSYRGSLLFDGVTILDALHNAGVGLCLHRQEHCATGTPSSRIFEIAASGAVAICQEHPFIRDVFRDSVLYLDTATDAQRLTKQIAEHMKWIAQNPEEALELSRCAYEIFAQNYTLEKLLRDLVPHHEELLRRKKLGWHRAAKIPSSKSTQMIVRVGDRSAAYVERALESICSQTNSHVGAILVQYKEVPGLPDLLQKYRRQLSVQTIESSYTGSRSTQLWDGLRAVSSEYFGILDDDDTIHPNHVSSLLSLLHKFSDCGVAYSGAIRVWESEVDSTISEELPSEPAELAYFEPFDPGRLTALDNFITSNSFVARSSLLDDLGDDPQLPLLEDLFLLLFLCGKTDFIFSYEATCEFRWRGNRKGNSVLLDQQKWGAARKRIETLLWKQSLPSAQQIGHSSLSELQRQVDTRLARIETTLAETKAEADVTALRLDRYVNLPFFRLMRKIRRQLFRLPEP
jgi:hypothetical protein